ncbi:MAG: HD domain-containing protein, partial [Cyanobacteria bacterium P01_H01_bin.58]
MTTSTLPTDCAIPDWLADCLLDLATHQNGHNGCSSQDKVAVESQAELSSDDLVRQAFEFAYALHQGQKRASGEAYICHPIEVAGLLRDLGGDSAMIAAGFL